MNIGPLKITVSQCTAGIYLRWWFNGWHHFLFTNGYEITMKTESQDIITTQYFSVISKIERDTRITSDYAYHISLHGIQPGDIEGFTNLLLAERVEQYEGGIWREVDVTRGNILSKMKGRPVIYLSSTLPAKKSRGPHPYIRNPLNYISGILFVTWMTRRSFQ